MFNAAARTTRAASRNLQITSTKISSGCIKSTHKPPNFRNAAQIRKMASAASLNTKVVESGTYSSPRPSIKCGELRASHIGEKVTIAGWLSSIRQVSAQLAFLVLRDSHGPVQVKIELDAGGESVAQFLKTLTLESIICIRGEVNARPSNMINKDMATGEIEVAASEIELLNKSDPVPVPFHRDAIGDSLSEEVRLRYRYLELRQPNLQRNIRLRSRILQLVRDNLLAKTFVEVETPTLFRKTSEGAREYIVPTRAPGKFYTLTQSPQQYKQLLMASGFDRYFQIARCYRDENLRADRQPEFTQIDMEMAFIQQEDIQNVIESLLADIWRETLGIDLPRPFKRLTYRYCMDNYGSDKPDTRFGFKLHDVSDALAKTQVGIFQKVLSSGGKIKAVNIKALGGHMNDKEIEQIQAEAKSQGKGVVTVKVHNGQWKTSIAKHLTPTEIEQLNKDLDAHDGDLLLIAAGEGDDPLQLLGKLRLYCSNILQQKGLLVIPPNRFDFFWVVDFPLFTWEDGVMSATHHPFTAPVSEDAHMLLTHPEKVRGQHYDIVMNGMELGGGSIRIHRPEEQIKVFRDVLKLPASKVNEFSHLIEALGHGCPPHGGIALGLDRLVAVALGAKSLREVIAFPKSGTGAELLTGSPSELGLEELRELAANVQSALDARAKTDSGK